MKHAAAPAGAAACFMRACGSSDPMGDFIPLYRIYVNYPRRLEIETSHYNNNMAGQLSRGKSEQGAVLAPLVASTQGPEIEEGPETEGYARVVKVES